MNNKDSASRRYELQLQTHYQIYTKNVPMIVSSHFASNSIDNLKNFAKFISWKKLQTPKVETWSNKRR